MMDPVQLAKKLIGVISTSGEEAKMFEVLSRLLTGQGYRTSAIWSEKGRPNLLAYIQKPEIIFCSHLDTVPPYIPLREDRKFLYGRGACDTKGVIAAQLVSAFRMKSQGIKNIGFLFLVGEEEDHRGAIDVSKKLPRHFRQARAIIVGEPTENKLAVATKGIVKITLRARGKAAHSAYPKLGYSAIHPMIEALSRLNHLSLPTHPLLGKTTLNIGRIQGGVAANVFADYAEAHVLVRTVTPSRSIFKKLKRQLKTKERAKIKIILDSINDPIKLSVEKGFKTTTVAFNTDVPYLNKIAKRLYLFGPGSILNAHGPYERILKKEIHHAVTLYEKLVKKIL